MDAHVSRTPEAVPLSDKEKVMSALQHNLDGEALARWMGMSVGMQTPVESFTKWIADFNACSPVERGQGKYDHGRPLEPRAEDITVPLTSPSGYAYTATLHADGQISFATSLAS